MDTLASVGLLMMRPSMQAYCVPLGAASHGPRRGIWQCALIYVQMRMCGPCRQLLGNAA